MNDSITAFSRASFIANDVEVPSKLVYTFEITVQFNLLGLVRRNG